MLSLDFRGLFHCSLNLEMVACIFSLERKENMKMGRTEKLFYGHRFLRKRIVSGPKSSMFTKVWWVAIHMNQYRDAAVGQN